MQLVTSDPEPGIFQIWGISCSRSGMSSGAAGSSGVIEMNAVSLLAQRRVDQPGRVALDDTALLQPPHALVHGGGRYAQGLAEVGEADRPSLARRSTMRRSRSSTCSG